MKFRITIVNGYEVSDNYCKLSKVEGKRWKFAYYSSSSSIGVFDELPPPVFMEASTTLYPPFQHRWLHTSPPIHHESGMRFHNLQRITTALHPPHRYPIQFPLTNTNHLKSNSNLNCTMNDISADNLKGTKETQKSPEIPPPPEKPLPGDCCGSGCVRCVWDVYFEELAEYNKLYKRE
ncbi:putative Oxidoreductase-like domain-containing protein [Helianthus annuus]|uniref:Oxidoreductase-like domain-containing protein n=1 Tax=Helianthus annuus TaxID=4232 RepID=A0A9K3N8P7_HELAN|nr:putative Oxidoreductase-like domain-containing protein [Helianthus annuus]KAJ0526395.1 putative Oxidoreductase-like domain-containing protein [Helianthus annuus]KAJ0534821.1 putative Oxidoreductase-like domain-containing protein [Helianthus annuus]KAJ0542786.1 putative Oxidoreductase-like domain-containing protein [Helianthus annuus]KAJ0799080.1 putative Oxidoreductase-like domain-containing protein [Helianthus annuus]